MSQDYDNKATKKGVFRVSSHYGNIYSGKPREPHGSVALDWSHNPNGEIAAWASSFKFAAQILVNGLSQREAYADREACPIIFLFRHSLELFLKSLLLESTTLAEIEGESFNYSRSVLGGHALWPLLEPLEPVFTRFDRTFVREDEAWCTFRELVAVVQEFDQFDRGSLSFRYPVQKDFLTAALPFHLHFDIFDLSRRVSRVLDTLQDLMAAVGRDISTRVTETEEEEEC